MKIRRFGLVTCAVVLATSLTFATTEASPPPADPDDRHAVYRGVVDGNGMDAIVALGVDRHEIVRSGTGDPTTVAVEVVLTGQQAAQLSAIGVELTTDDTSSQRITALAAPVFRPYSGAGGLQEEMITQAAAHRHIAELVVIGQSWQGQDIVAVRVTKHASKVRDGKRPATVFMGAQHAREWITPEMVRRLLDLVLDGYGADPQITRLVNTTEMWFIPVANPDGYDHSFVADRLWRKNLRDNDGNGEITVGDGVDLNRNFPTRWGYDNEGSSPLPSSDTYRGPSPASEPETQALDRLFARIRPEFLVNYHSAAELLLHGIGWQVATPGPDDVIYEAMVGDDANPAVPGYDPDLSAELYTTNGDTDTHMQEAHGTLGFTPEMSTCQVASASVPDDAWDPADCESVFHFPDDEALIQAEFLKNVPFALAVAASAPDPDDPVSVVGREAEDFRVDAFDVSYGNEQTVAVVAKRALAHLRVNYRINGGRVRTTSVREWRGGERYGFENDVYYAEYRGKIRARAGDTVEVWFSGWERPGRHERGRKRYVQSEHFTYSVVQATGNDVLVIANEDHTGVNPTYPPEVTGPKYLDEHVDALLASGVTPDVWDVDAQGVPHDLGVLSHYDAIVWYLGDNRLTQDPEDELTSYFGSEIPDLAVAERQQYLTLAVRDFLNEGGKLIHAGETTAYYGLGGSAFGGIFYGLNGAPDQECVVVEDPFAECLLLADDFTQYYLGAYSRTALESASGVIATAGPLAGQSAAFGGPAVVDNPIDEVGALTATSDILPVSEFPQFASEPVADYLDPVGDFIPVEGAWAVGAEHADDSYMRLARTIDLTAVTVADAPRFTAQMSFDTEEGYDHVIVEVHTVGQDDWTTLPEANGGTTTAVPTECEAGFLLAEHPFLERYLTLGEPCTATGTTGSWNSFTSSSGGWTPVEFDLSAYAGRQIELVISYVTDPFTGGAGVMVDDTAVVTNAGVIDAEGFETGLGVWSVLGAPEGSPGNLGDFERSVGVGGIHAAIATEDTLLLGFGLEQLEDPGARAAVMSTALATLLG